MKWLKKREERPKPKRNAPYMITYYDNGDIVEGFVEPDFDAQEQEIYAKHTERLAQVRRNHLQEVKDLLGELDDAIAELRKEQTQSENQPPPAPDRPTRDVTKRY
jgi:hypothetical protein